MSELPTTAMMRIAIAGGGGLADIFLRELSQTANSLVVLSRTERPDLESSYGCQVAAVDYGDSEGLQWNLQGVDLVISTIPGGDQVNLINAAKRARVRCFVPSEFEGALSHRPGDGDALDRGSSAALDRLRHLSASKSHPMKFTVFSCGIFYERFAPGGLATYNLGASLHIQQEGDYMVDLSNCTAMIPEAGPSGRSVHLSMTSAFDVARFVTAAVEWGIENWPREFKMRGDHMSIRRLVAACEEVRGVQFSITSIPYAQLSGWLQYYQQASDWTHWYQMQHIIQTAKGRYDFSGPLLNDSVNFQALDFQAWLQQYWGSVAG